MRLARILTHAPHVIGIGMPDDGWLCAALRIAGRKPVWVNDGDPSKASAFLSRMGLPGLASGTPEAIIGPSLRMDSSGTGAPQPLPPPEGEDRRVVQQQQGVGHVAGCAGAHQLTLQLQRLRVRHGAERPDGQRLSD